MTHPDVKKSTKCVQTLDDVCQWRLIKIEIPIFNRNFYYYVFTTKSHYNLSLKITFPPIIFHQSTIFWSTCLQYMASVS